MFPLINDYLFIVVYKLYELSQDDLHLIWKREINSQ